MVRPASGSGRSWRRHRLALERAVIDLRGFGQAALNNASEQERTSSAGGSGATGSWAGGCDKKRPAISQRG